MAVINLTNQQVIDLASCVACGAAKGNQCYSDADLLQCFSCHGDRIITAKLNFLESRDKKDFQHHLKESVAFKSIEDAISADAINPQHYKSHPSGVEAIEILKHHSYSIGAALKYLWRCGLKKNADEIEDLEKAIRYIQFEIQLIKERKSNENS